jgi:hypothetical protein
MYSWYSGLYTIILSKNRHDGFTVKTVPQIVNHQPVNDIKEVKPMLANLLFSLWCCH